MPQTTPTALAPKLLHIFKHGTWTAMSGERIAFSAQVQQRVQLDGYLGRTKWCPVKQAQAQVDGGRIQRIDAPCDVHIQAQWLVGIELIGASNQDYRKVRPDARGYWLLAEIGLRSPDTSD